MGEPEIVVARDASDLAARAAELVIATIGSAIERRGRADLALSGGSTPVALYHALATPPWRDRADWTRVHLWLGDERFVPLDHPESNAFLIEQTLLGAGAFSDQSGDGTKGTDVLDEDAPGVAVPAAHMHVLPIREAIATGRGPGWVAERYAAELAAALPAGANGAPAFDLILLGVGPDGHTLSVFPDSAVLDGGGPIVAAVPAPTHVRPHRPRITIDPRLLHSAGLVLVLVEGAGKAPVLARVFSDPVDPKACPAQLARREGVVWIVDQAAAAGLPAGAMPAATASAGVAPATV